MSEYTPAGWLNDAGGQDMNAKNFKEWDPMSYGSRDPEKYNYGSMQSLDARTFDPNPNHAYDVNAAQSQGTQLNAGNYNQVRGQQMGLAQSLTNAMNGQGPSAAAMAADTQRQQNQAAISSAQAGQRGRTAGASARFGMNALMGGNQAAAQGEAMGRANEMNTARNALGGVYQGMAGNDISVAGQNAQLGQQNNQWNAGAQNTVAMGNQSAQLGISAAELAARQHQGDMSFSNLDQGSAGIGGDIAGMAGAVGSIWGKGGGGNGNNSGGNGQAAHGTVALPRYADGGVLGIGQRKMPVDQYNSATTWAHVLEGLAGGYMQGRGEKEKAQEIANDKAAEKAKWDSFFNNLSQQNQPTAGTQPYNATVQNSWQSGPVTVPQYGHGAVLGSGIAEYPIAQMIIQAMRDGGGHDEPPMTRGPHTAVVGEAGPEAIVPLKDIVNRPTVRTLGTRPEAVIPLSSDRQGDRDHITGLALHIANAMRSGR